MTGPDTGSRFSDAGIEAIREVVREELTNGPDAVMHYSTPLPAEGIVCALCLFAVPGQAQPAATVIAGTAVCVDHAGYVADGRFGSIVHLVKQHEGPT